MKGLMVLGMDSRGLLMLFERMARDILRKVKVEIPSVFDGLNT